MKLVHTEMPGLVRVLPEPRYDERGYFMETYRKDLLLELGIYDDFVQHNETLSLARGTIRGFHFQVPGYNRLVRVTRGLVKLVMLDLRAGSPMADRCSWMTIGDTDLEWVYIPEGIAWAFQTFTDNVKMEYISSKIYNGAADRTIRYDEHKYWDDIAPIVSARDQAGMTIAAWRASEEASQLTYVNL